MANMKNINNLIALRKMAFGIYQPLAMKAQNFIILMTMVFGFGSYVLYASIYAPYTSKVAYFYGTYQPIQLWWYYMAFSVFFLIPISITFLIIFTYEMQINQYFVVQQNLWYQESKTFNRLANFGSHYFCTGYEYEANPSLEP